jgi:hypothetical protein
MTTNLALRKNATQSGTVSNWGAWASRAVDGNTNGNWEKNYVTHTNWGNGAWWMVDLGKNSLIGSVTIFNRINCCEDRLQKFYVELLDAQGNVVDDGSHYRKEASPAELGISFPGISAQFVRVRFREGYSMYLSLAEVEVYGPTEAPTNSPTNAPTNAPTNVPTNAPTDTPTDTPTNSPTKAPTVTPIPLCVCVAPSDNLGWPCIQANGVCHPLSDEKCVHGTTPCTPVTPVPTLSPVATASNECEGCWPGTSGPCKQDDINVCHPLVNGECTTGTTAC